MIVFLLNGIVTGLLASVWAYTAGWSIWAAVLCYAPGGIMGMLITVALQLLTEADAEGQRSMLPQVADR